MKSITKLSFLNLRLSLTEISKSNFAATLFLFCLFFSNSAAQVNVTLEQFRAILTPGQIHYYTNSDETIQKVNIGNTGGPNIYDFTNLSLPDYEASTNYYVSDIPNMALRFPSDAITMGNLDLIEKNPVFLFRHDTIYVLGQATNTPPEQYIHNAPYQMLAKFPIEYGASFSQTLMVYDTTFNSSGGIASTDSYVENNITTVDGFGKLKIDNYQFECLRIKLDHTNLGDKEFIFMTREGIFVNIAVASSEADTGEVNLLKMMILRAENLTDVKETNTEIPLKFMLSQNYPNPFNPSTYISFELPTNCYVSLKVYDVLGREVETLINSEMNHGKSMSSGIYFYTLRASDYMQTKKMILMK